MKKLLALLLVLVMVFSLCACTAEDDSKSSKKPTTATTEPTKDKWAGKEPTGTEPTEPTEPIEDDNPTTAPTEGGVSTTEPTAPSVPVEPNEAILAYVEANREDMISTMEYTFATSSGLTCTSDIEVIGNGFVIYIYINELSNVDQYTKNQLQAAYDQMGEYFNTLLEMLQHELPEVEYFDVWVCDVNHDVLAIIHAGE